MTQNPTDPIAPDGTRGKFSIPDAAVALVEAAMASRRCKTPDGPTGTGKVKSVFDPGTGRIILAEIVTTHVEGAHVSRFAHTAVGECVARTFLTVKIRPFDGSPVAVTKSFHIE